jgi:MoxR-like ATPase
VAETTQPAESFDRVSTLAARLLDNIETVVHGKRDEVTLVLSALIAGGHVLLEDVPGTAKTMLARSIGGSIEGANTSRIQCTPDLQPTDVTGLSIFNQKEREFEFRAGPIFANVVLVDEINRAMPKTQSALLEAMAEGRISVEGRQKSLPDPFFMIATENPVEFEGTFPLPEAQKDRFFLTLRMGYPPPAAEEEVMASQRRLTHPVTDLQPVTDLAELLELQKEVLSVEVSEPLADHIVGLVAETRTDPRLQLGASPRASMALYRGAQALAALRGRSAATPADVRELVPPVLLKRITLRSEHLLKGLTEERVIGEILERTAASEVVR